MRRLQIVFCQFPPFPLVSSLYVFTNSLTIFARFFCALIPLLCKEGQGEVEAFVVIRRSDSTPPILPLQRGGKDDGDPYSISPFCQRMSEH